MGVVPPPDSAAHVRFEEEHAGSARIVQQIVGVISVALAVLAMVFFGSAVDRQLSEFRSAQISGVEWGLGRSIADYHDLNHAVNDLDPGSTSKEVESELSTFSEWITRFQNGEIYAPQRGNQSFSSALENVRQELRHISDIVSRGVLGEGDIENLGNSVEKIETDLLKMERVGLEEARASAARLQYDAAGTLVRLAGFVALLLITLLLLTIYLSWQGRILLSRARREARTATRLEAILGSSEDGVIVTGRDDAIQMMGASAVSLLDVDADNTHRSSVANVLGLSFEDVRNLQEETCGSVVEREVRTSSGRKFPAEISVRMSRSSDEEIVVFFIRDITHRKDIEDMFRL
jgi:PAS domain S-box-containing protein